MYPRITGSQIIPLPLNDMKKCLCNLFWKPITLMQSRTGLPLTNKMGLSKNFNGSLSQHFSQPPPPKPCLLSAGSFRLSYRSPMFTKVPLCQSSVLIGQFHMQAGSHPSLPIFLHVRAPGQVCLKLCDQCQVFPLAFDSSLQVATAGILTIQEFRYCM